MDKADKQLDDDIEYVDDATLGNATCILGTCQPLLRTGDLDLV